MKELTDKEFNWLKKLEKEIDKSWDELTDWERRKDVYRSLQQKSKRD